MSKNSSRASWVGAALVAAAVAGCGVAGPSTAEVFDEDIGVGVNPLHAWGSYHWARTANPFTIKLGDSVGSAWDATLATTSTDWSVSTVLDTAVVPGSGTDPKKCVATIGRVEVCNASYGGRGWLGIASIWLNATGHITKASVKLNDFYFNNAKYNTPEWRNLVSCQEVGHTLGLDHQDENQTNPNLGTCMDYTSSPASNQHPNAHDYAQLDTIYGHADSTTTVAFRDPDGYQEGLDLTSRPRLFRKELEDGTTMLTWVVWEGVGLDSGYLPSRR